MLTLNQVSVRKLNRYILQDLSLTINKGEIVSLIGENGAGKSTLCRLLTGSLKPSSGFLSKPKSLRLSYVPQVFNQSSALPIRAIDFILMGQKSKENESTLLKLAHHTLVEKALYTNLSHLSGGEFQKVLLLRALIRKPQLLILDEAFSFLDLGSLRALNELIFSEQKKAGFTLLLVSHDIHFVLKATTKVICLHKGKLHCMGSNTDIKETPFVQNILQKYVHNPRAQ